MVSDSFILFFIFIHLRTKKLIYIYFLFVFCFCFFPRLTKEQQILKRKEFMVTIVDYKI